MPKHGEPSIARPGCCGTWFGLGRLHHSPDDIAVQMPERLRYYVVFFTVRQRRPEHRGHEFGWRTVAMVLDAMHRHLGSDEEEIAAGNAKVADAMCSAAELAGVEPAALSRQAKQQARQRSAKERSASARKAARTRLAHQSPTAAQVLD
jgi:hypothetical protein